MERPVFVIAPRLASASRFPLLVRHRSSSVRSERAWPGAGLLIFLRASLSCTRGVRALASLALRRLVQFCDA